MSKTGIKVKLPNQTDLYIGCLSGFCREALRKESKSNLEFEIMWWDFFDEIQKCQNDDQKMLVIKKWFDVE